MKNILNTEDFKEEGILTIYGVMGMLPDTDKVDELAEEWCDKNAECWNAQNSAYIAGMTDLIEAINELGKLNRY